MGCSRDPLKHPKVSSGQKNFSSILILEESIKNLKVFFFLMVFNFIFGGAGSLLLQQAFSACSGQGLLSHCRVRASHCGASPHFGAQALRAWLSGCGSWALEHRLSTVAHGLVAPWHVGSSPTRIGDGTGIPCVAGCCFSTEPLGKPLKKF